MSKHLIRTLGLALIAALAMSVATAASALAALPEFKAKAGETLPVSFSSKNKAGVEPKLHSNVLGEKNVACKTSAVTGGEVANATEVTKIKVTYKECKEEGTSNACTTAGEASGVIVTKEIHGKIGYVEKVAKLVGIELKPVSGTVFASFTCSGIAGSVTVEGCTIGEAKPINKLSATGELLFKEVGGKQQYEKLEGGATCTQTVTAGPFKTKGTGWVTDEEEQTFAKEIDLEA